jgi:hypothetical protein
MPYEITKVDVWAATIKDQPGGLAAKLEALADAGASLEFVIARRAPESPGKGVVFVAPIRGAAQQGAARKAKFRKAKSLCSLRVSGSDKAGLGARITQAIADAGINMRGLSAAALGRKCVVYFAFDSAADASKAARVLRKTLNR